MSRVTKEKILTLARQQIGTKATAVKKCKYNTAFWGYEVSGDWADWCAAFVWWLFHQYGADDMLYVKTAGCGELGNAFYKRGKFKTSSYQTGDIVFFHWSNARSGSVPGTYSLDHVGIIENVNADGSYITIEGNTGGTAYGEVKRQTRYGYQISGAARPDYLDSGAVSVSVNSQNKTAPNIFYRVRTNGKWLSEVKNTEDFAGIQGFVITDIAIGTDIGSVKYRVHVKGGNWLPYVTGCDISDCNNGYAGNGHEIDAVEIIYYTDIEKSGEYYFAKYRVSAVGKAYYDWQYDNITNGEQDGYAGDFGNRIDRLCIELVKY